MEALSQKMVNSDHRSTYIKKVMASLLKYSTMLKNSLLSRNHPAYKPLHLGNKYNSYGRWRKKVMARESWFKDLRQKAGKKRKNFQKAGEEKIQTSTVMFIPSTRGGMLTRLMKENEQELSRMTKFKVRYQEAQQILPKASLV